MMGEVFFPIYGNFVVTSPYGSRTPQSTGNGNYSSAYHYGIDLVPVDNNRDSQYAMAVTSGVVKKSFYQGTSSTGYGNVVWIAGDDGKGTIYAHLKQRLVNEGDVVKPKQPIGIIGSTGSSTGKHLHFGVSNNTSYSETHENKGRWFFNPAIYFGLSPYSDLKGKTIKGTELPAYKYNINDKSADSVNATSGSINSMIEPSGEYYEIKDIKGTTSDWLYGRRYRIIVDLGNGDALDVSELRCKFDIKKSAYTQIQTSSIKIYNLIPQDENKIIENGLRIIIEAGYNGSFYGKIFEGNVIQAVRSKESGVDYCLTLISMDSDRYVASGVINKSLNANQSERDAIQALSSDSTVKSEVGIISHNQVLSYPRGKVMFGKASSYLAQIAKSNNAMYYNSDGKINIIGTEYESPDEIFALSPESGLLDFPRQTQYGITCTCLLNPYIKLNSKFMIENKRIAGFEYQYGTEVRPLDSNGIYRAIELNYVGDTRGNDWKTEITAITQAGSLPAMAAGSGILIF